MSESVVRDPSLLRIAYFISSYGSGAQLLRLVRTIRRAEPDSPIVVHHDEFAREPLDRSLFDGLDVTVFGGVERIAWGEMALESARWRIFRWITGALDVDWVMLLSEQDYPIAPFAAFRERLAASGADAIMQAQRIDEIVDARERRQTQDRYYYSYAFIPKLGLARRWPPAVRRAAAATERAAVGLVRRSFVLNVYRGVPAYGMRDRIGVRTKHRLFSPEFPCWVNESWFAISARGMRAVLHHVDTHPGFVRHYARTVIPVESATATILCNTPGLVIENDLLHEIGWSERESGRPDLVTLADLPRLYSSSASFTRKIAPDEIALLDALDQRVFAGQSA
jgi:hypothetical protein